MSSINKRRALIIMQPQGNYYNKYESKNIITNKVMKDFFEAFSSILKSLDYKSVFEVGAGEGYVTNFIYNLKNVENISATDISEKVVSEAQIKYPYINFSQGSAYDTGKEKSSIDLVVACEVLEHLEFPEEALKELFDISNNYLFISVPNEPIWRICNFCSGRYMKDLGNTPGHINHWSTSGIVNLTKSALGITDSQIVCVEKPFPWTMILIKK